MIGASKLNKQDVLNIKKLIQQGLNDCHISRVFVSENGHKVSREHILQIRKGNRWNTQKHSFLMKEDLLNLPHIITMVGNDIYETQLGWLKTKTMERWFILTVVNDVEVDGPSTSLLTQKPSTEDLMTFHQDFIKMYL